MDNTKAHKAKLHWWLGQPIQLDDKCESDPTREWVHLILKLLKGEGRFFFVEE